MTSEINNPKISHVIFDMDGLILDTETLYTKATLNITQKYGKDFPFELKKKLMGRTGLESATLLVADLELPLTVEEYMTMIEVEYRRVFSEHIPTLPGAERLIRHLHTKQVPIAVATSSREFTFKLKTQFHQELFGLFDHIVIAPDDPEISAGKPDPQTFLVCAKRFRIPPVSNDQVLVFEDSPAGVEAANRAGMRSVWVPDSRASRDSSKPFLTLNSLEEFYPEKFGLPPFDVSG